MAAGVLARRWWALVAIVLCMLTIGLDTTILNVALPTLAGAVHASTSQLQWIVDAYVLVFAGLLLPAGALGDRYGHKVLLLVGLLFFGGSSAVASFVDSPTQLIVIRAMMGIGGAILTPTTMAVLAPLFPDSRERTKAIAVATAATGLGLPLGPLVGGYLLEHFWWGSIFLVNIPVVALAMIAVAALVPNPAKFRSSRIDLWGGLLSSIGLVAIVYGIIEAPDKGWGSGVVIGSLVAGALVLAGFVVWQQRAPYPMIDLHLFRNQRFLFGTLVATITSFALFGLLFVLPQYLQLVRNNTAFGTGLRLVPLMAGLMVAAGLAQRLSLSVGSKIPIAIGLAVLGGGLIFAATTSVTTGYGTVASWLAITGFGTGMALAPAMDAVLGSLPPDREGSGSGLTMTIRQVGGAFGVAILGSVLAGVYQARVPAAGRESLAAATAVAAKTHDAGLLVTAQQAYLHGMARVLVVCAVLALLGALMTVIALPARAPEPADKQESDHGQLARLA
jgi:EmrB/QacA subfamily drug resistance transporter